MIVAVIALFLGLTGSVVAGVKIAKNSISTSQVKNGSLKGGDLAKDTLTGAQIKEETLGTVPRAASANTAQAAQAAVTAQSAQTAKSAERASSADRAASAGSADRAGSAATADRAGDADRLGGKTADQFVSRAEVLALAAKLQAGESRTLLERDGVRILARCQVGVPASGDSTADLFTVWAESSRDGAMLDSPSTGNRLDGTGGLFLGPGTSDARRQLLYVAENRGATRTRVRPGFSVTSAGGTTIFAGFGQPTVDGAGDKSSATNSIRVSFGLYGAACAISAPVMISSFG